MIHSTLACDSLTQALTRQAGEHWLREALRRVTPQHPLAVMFFDLDHFKSINDAFGHTVGDAVLQAVAGHLKQRLAGQGVIVRYGGDEFYIALPDTGRDQARAWAQEALRYFATHPLKVGTATTLYARLSIGVAVAPMDGHTPEEILEVADRRHYFAKYSGGHCVILDDRSATQSLIARPRRPIGQHRERNRLYELISTLIHYPTGVIRIQSPPYGGASSFLSIARDAARLNSYTVLEISLTPALQWRYLGAFHHALNMAGLAEYVETETEVMQVVRRLVEQSQRGVLLSVAFAEWLDAGSLRVIQRLLSSPLEGKHFALVYATTLESFAPEFHAPFFEQLHLSPLQTEDVRAWIRHALRWEPSEACVAWVMDVTQGLPELIHPTLESLVREGYLQATDEGWKWFPPDRWRPPRPAPPPLQHAGVPPDLPLLFGRNRDLSVLQDLVRNHTLLTVAAPVGMGRSRLLQQLVIESTAAFAEGAYYITPYGGFERLAELVARVLKIPLNPQSAPLEQVIEALKGRHMLLVLDELEQHPDLQDFIQAVLHRAPQVHLVVGAHHRLQHPREVVYALKGIAWEGESDAPAIQLFFHFSQQNGAPLSPSAETISQVRQICHWAQGNPLALRIMASWTTSLPLDFLLDWVQCSALQTNPLHAVMSEFWNMLSPVEQETLAGLAVFRGPFEAVAAATVAGASPFFLDALVAKTYLERLPQQRFRLSGTLRRFALEKLHRMNPLWIFQVERQHAIWYLEGLPRHRGITSPDLLADYLAPVEEIPDVLAAWRWALQAREWRLLSSAALWVFNSLGDRNRFIQAYQLAEETLAVLVHTPPRERDQPYYALRAQVETARAEFKHHLGDSEAAMRWLQKVRSRLGSFLSPWHQAYLARVLGRVYMNLGQYQQAEVELQQVLHYYRTRGGTRALLDALRAMEVVKYLQRDLEEAEAYAHEALVVAQEAGLSSAAAAFLNNLGVIEMEQNRLDQARETLRRALETLGDYDAPSLRASIYDSRGRVELALGEHCRALEYLGEALRHALSIGALPNALEALTTTARVWAAMGRVEEARGLAKALLTYKALSSFNRGELQEMLSQLPPQGPEAATAWAVEDIHALAQRVRELNRRWCSSSRGG